jgi:hypothetical protein
MDTKLLDMSTALAACLKGVQRWPIAMEPWNGTVALSDAVPGADGAIPHPPAAGAAGDSPATGG